MIELLSSPIICRMNSKRNAGFTAIELMITLALAAIVLAIGVPSYRSFIERNSTSKDVNEFVSALSLARNEAISRGGLCVAVVPLFDGNWSSGWAVGTLSRDDCPPLPNVDVITIDDIDQQIRSYEALRRNSFTVTPVNVVFQPSGAVFAARNFTLTPNECSDANRNRRISIGPTGLVTMELSEC